MRRALDGVVALVALLPACAYYNAMWSAERFAKEARRLEARGQEAEARSQWARAATKAESVLVRHPRSRWADAALVLQAEGLARAGTCVLAAAPIAEALRTIGAAPLRERAGLAAARCALANGRPVEAERALGEALVSDDSRRRSQAELLAGHAAAARRAHDAAVAHFRRSTEPGALPGRARALLAAGRVADAAAVLDTVAGAEGGFQENDWTGLLDELAAAGGPAVASAALDRLLARARVPLGARARLLIADGDRRLALGEHAAAIERYRQARDVAPVGSEAGVAQVRAQRAVVAGAAAPSDLALVVAELSRIAEQGGAGGGAGVADARRLLDRVVRLTARPETPGAGFRAAELARDSLGAPRLAGRLFLDLAAADPTSLFAPKALLAALPLLPDRRDSIVGVLDTAYPASPYTRALHGEASPAYAAAEDSLAQELGVRVARALPVAGPRVAAPLTGERGPWLDGPPPRTRPAARGADADAPRLRPEEPARRPAAERPPAERPPRPPRR